MEAKTVDKTKLMTVHNYAAKIGKTPQWVYQMIKDGTVKSEKIDGVIFVKQ